MRAGEGGRESDVEAEGEREKCMNDAPQVGVRDRLRILGRAILGWWSLGKATSPADITISRQLSRTMSTVEGAHELLQHGEHGVLFRCSIGRSRGRAEGTSAWWVVAEELLEFSRDLGSLGGDIVI